MAGNYICGRGFVKRGMGAKLASCPLTRFNAAMIRLRLTRLDQAGKCTPIRALSLGGLGLQPINRYLRGTLLKIGLEQYECGAKKSCAAAPRVLGRNETGRALSIRTEMKIELDLRAQQAARCQRRQSKIAPRRGPIRRITK